MDEGRVDDEKPAAAVDGRAARAVTRPPLPVSIGGTGVRPGVNLSSNAALIALLDEGVPLDELR